MIIKLNFFSRRSECYAIHHFFTKEERRNINIRSRRIRDVSINYDPRLNRAHAGIPVDESVNKKKVENFRQKFLI